MNGILRIKERVGPPLQASKWLKCPVLLDLDEMQALFQELGEFWLFLISGVCRPGEETLSKDDFLDCYHAYMTALKQGQLSEDPRIRSYFSAALTVTPDALYAVRLSDEQELVKVERPVIQMQAHKFDYSSVDGKFRSMVLGSQSISWGIQFSYPQLYQDAHLQIHSVRQSPDFPNTAVFHRLQRWMRHQTIATPFIVNERRVNVPIRLGKKCLNWINNHPQLQARGLQVFIPPNKEDKSELHPHY